MNKLRLFIATVMIWIASKIAPRPMGPVFRTYARMLEKFPLELLSGRTFGVMTIPWALSDAGKGKAQMMQDRGLEAMTVVRQGIEEISK